MTRQCVMAVALLVAMFSVPAPAAAQEFYIVRDAATNACHIVQDRPTDLSVDVLNDTAYTTVENAEGVMRTVCGRH
jgi:hypothetical protein